jgi:hypothetical protein
MLLRAVPRAITQHQSQLQCFEASANTVSGSEDRDPEEVIAEMGSSFVSDHHHIIYFSDFFSTSREKQAS